MAFSNTHIHERKTLFFNLSHEDFAGKTYYLTGGGRRYALTEVAKSPEVLANARQTNAFLRAVPDTQITHHVENAEFATDSVTLAYVSSELDVEAGTWSMSSVQMNIPQSAAAHAYRHAREQTPTGPLPLSAKRRHYGIAAAQTEQDLLDERALLDVVSHSETMVGCHPDLLSLEPGSAHIIYSNHVGRSVDVGLLALKLSQPEYGAATPEQTPGQPNATGWATLQPVLDDKGQPIKNQKGNHAKRIQYLPSMHPNLHALAWGGMNDSVQSVKDDVSLGADITGKAPGGNQDPSLNGKMWLRHDGLATAVQIPSAIKTSVGNSVSMVLKELNNQAGYKVQATSTQSGTSVKVNLTLLNWFLEFRGIYLQFLDENDQILKLIDIPEYKNSTIITGHDNGLDTNYEMWTGPIGAVYTLFGIPVAPSYAQPSFTVPEMANTVRILSSGLSFQGGNTYPQTVLAGALMTGFINYGVTALLCGLGAASFLGGLQMSVAAPTMFRVLTLEIITAVNAALNPNGDTKALVNLLASPGFWIGQALVLAKTLVTEGSSDALKSLLAKILTAIVEGEIEDSLPIVGQVMQAISITAGAISIGETTIDLSCTPWTYVDDLVFTHNLSVNLIKDPNDSTFPKAANSYTVKALFEDGTPYVQTFDIETGGVASLPPVVFTEVPLGGKVNLSVAFVQKASTPGQEDILLGKGSTGLIPNIDYDSNNTPSITLQEIKYPISSKTVYQHNKKTTLDPEGNHVWANAPAPDINKKNTVCAGAGTLCGFNSITVCQGTSTTAGYLGYAWRGQNTDQKIAPSCIGGGIGQLDQMAILSTDDGANGANAQQGYTNNTCGIGVPGIKLAYSLLSHGADNFYLDTTNPNTPLVRRVTLGSTPAFDSPLSNQSYGVLNFSSDSLLLHPSGHLVSINNQYHKIETLKLPKASMADADAMTNLVAQVKSGKGTRAGLIHSPVASAISPDGVILVLENGNNRIQAFDLGGNPVRHFNKQTASNSSPYSLTLGGTDPMKNWRYLDLAVEYTGYLYVLSFNEETFYYRLDIYHPDQADTQPISTTIGINAARLTVDFWRNVYTLNYEVLRLPNSLAAGLTEPSVSLWLPSASN